MYQSQRSIGTNFTPMRKWMIAICVMAYTAVGIAQEKGLLQSLQQHDKAVHMLGDTWMRDPFITLAPDGFYYLTYTANNNDLPDSMAAITCMRSKDLVAWQNLGILWRADNSVWGRKLLARAAENNAKATTPHDTTGYLKVPASGNIAASSIGVAIKPAMIWAPEIHLVQNKWVIMHTSNQGMANLMLTNGPDLTSPWQEPFAGDMGRRHDPSLFTDDDGSHWMVYACTKIMKLKPDFTGFEGNEISIAPSNRKLGHEGSFIMKMKDRYVLFGTGWSRDTLRHGTYNLYYATSDRLTGGYGERKFAGRFLGHGTIFQDKAGKWWCTAFLNGAYQSPEKVAKQNVDASKATTINKQGLTLVPIDFVWQNGDIVVKVLDEHYAHPGKEEIQHFK